MDILEFESSIKKCFELTDREYLFTKLSYDRLLDILKPLTRGINRIHIANFRRSRNNFGEFRFITLQSGFIRSDNGEYQTVTLTAYGHGYNDCRDCYTANTWNFYIDYNNCYKGIDLPPLHTIKQLEDEHKNYNDTPIRNKTYAILEELGDSDSAYSELFQ
jgi:hypothetical protein